MKRETVGRILGPMILKLAAKTVPRILTDDRTQRRLLSSPAFDALKVHKLKKENGKKKTAETKCLKEKKRKWQNWTILSIHFI